MGDLWGCDAPVSMPEPPRVDQPVLTDFNSGGFGFTSGGIVHTITAAHLEQLVASRFAPAGDQ